MSAECSRVQVESAMYPNILKLFVMVYRLKEEIARISQENAKNYRINTNENNLHHSLAKS